MSNFNNKINIKKLVIILLGITIISYAAVAVICVSTGKPIFVKNGEFSFNHMDSKYPIHKINESSSMNLEGINEIYINIPEADFNITNTSAKEFKAEAAGTISTSGNYTKPEFKCYKSGDTLNVEFDDKISGVMLSFTYNIKINMYIPDAYRNSVRISSGSGDIAVSNCNLKSLDLKASEGKVDIDNITSDNFKCRNSSGDMDVRGLNSQSASFDLSEGKLSLTDIKADQLNYRNGAGDLQGDNVATKVTTLDSSEGGINIDGFTGDLNSKNSSGDTSISYSKFSNNINVNSSEGNIKINFPKDAKFNLDAEASEGNVKCDFPITIIGNKDENSLSGNVGVSQNKVTLRSSAGDIHVGD